MIPWQHQLRGVEETISLILQGERGICFTSPTGGGKTWCITELIRWARSTSREVMLYTNRKILLDQIQSVIAEAGIGHGIMAAGFTPDAGYDVQLASVQTMISRVYRMEIWKLPPAELVVVDEAHSNAAGGVAQILEDHKAAGAAVVGFTATPVDLAHLYDRLVIAGKHDELRACGALVPCRTYGPDEPDSRLLKVKNTSGDYSEPQIRRAMGSRTAIFGRVLEWFERINPEHRPTILFASSVPASLWFAEQFREAGISAAHVAGELVSYGEKSEDGDAVMTKSSREERDEILEGSRSGKIVVITNRFVMREGVDAPWLSHGILATVFGSVSSYLQSVGRLLRAYPGVRHVTLQDHGGNWWRHGCPNANRTWNLTYGPNVYSGLRETAMREKRMPEPIRCPQCGLIRGSGMACSCGYVTRHRSRMVVQLDGSLKQMSGDIFRRRRMAERTLSIAREWERIYWRCKNPGWDGTFSQAEAIFAREHDWHYPPKDLPLMPLSAADFYRKISEVPMDDLRPLTRKQETQMELI